MYVLHFLTAMLFAGGLFFIFCDLFKVPTLRTSRTMIGMDKQFKNKEKTGINSSLDELAKWLSKRLRIRDYKKAQMQANLNTARLTITPEMYMATCIVKALVVAFLSLLVFPIFMVGGIVILVVAIGYYIYLMKELERKVDAHRKALEFELVRMIFTIERTLVHDRNVILMLQNFREIAGPDMKQELDITLADMLSGNHEQAISRMEVRVGSMMMSDVCRGLISVIRGDDTTAYWINLEQKFQEHQRSMLRSKAERIPHRISRLSMTMLFSFLALWLGVLIVQMIDSFSELFQAI